MSWWTVATNNRVERLVATFGRAAMLELTHDGATEDDAISVTKRQMTEPKGFGISVFCGADLEAACVRFEELGVSFVKQRAGWKMKEHCLLSVTRMGLLDRSCFQRRGDLPDDVGADLQTSNFSSVSRSFGSRQVTGCCALDK